MLFVITVYNSLKARRYGELEGLITIKWLFVEPFRETKG